jgi:hypothetical protein
LAGSSGWRRFQNDPPDRETVTNFLFLLHLPKQPLDNRVPRDAIDLFSTSLFPLQSE